MPLGLDELYKAAYKGVSFLTDGGTISGGRKLVQHIFPNSNRQTQEDLGLKQRDYSLTAIISGDNYLNDRDNLVRVLEASDGPSTLTHPFHGEIENIVAESFSLTENFSEMGKATINIAFKISTDVGEQQEAEVNVNSIKSKFDTYKTEVQDNFADKFEITQSYTKSFEFALDKSNSFIDDFKESTQFMNDIAESFDQTTADIIDFKTNISSLLDAPINLASSINSLFENANLSSDVVQSKIDGFKNLFGFGSDDSDQYINTDVPANAERQINDSLMNGIVTSLALCNVYVAASESDFATEEQIIAEVEVLENEYNEIIKNETFDASSLDALSDVRTEANIFFEQIKKSAARTSQVNVNSIPMRVLAYNYYEDSNRAAELNTVNALPDVSFIKGEVNILSDQT